MHASPQPRVLDDTTFPAVLEAAKVGDARAAEVLFRDLQPRLLRFLRSTEPRAADDLAGDVWLGMARGLASFEGDLAGFRSWVFTIARRRLADHRRNATRRGTDPVEQRFFHDRADSGESGDTAANVLDRLSSQEALDLIAANLPHDQAEVLTLRIVGELDVAHVADVMGRSSNWVRVTQHRALQSLARHLGTPNSASEEIFPIV